MANGKKSFLAYCDWQEIFENLPDKDCAELTRHIFRYVNDESPVSENPIVNAVFIPIKNQLKRDLDKWESIREKRSAAGKASAIKRQQNQQVLTSVESVEQTSTNPTVTVTDNVNGSLTTSKETHENFIKLVSGQQGWLENVYMKFRIKHGTLAPLMNEFITHLGITTKAHHNLKDFQDHFYNWLLGKQSRGQLDKYIPGKRKAGDL